MRAAVVPSLGAPLEIRDVPIPAPGEGQVLVKIEASGLCHTDIHAARGDWPVKPKMPLIPGHEGVGSRRGRDRATRRPGRRPCGAALARTCVRALPLLRRWLGDLLPDAPVHGLHDGRQLRRVRPRLRQPRRHRSRRCLLDRRRADHVRGRDHLQGAEGRPTAARRDRHGRRHRRARAPGAAVRAHLRHHAPSPWTSTTRSCSSPRSSAPTTSIDGRGDQASALADLGGVDIAVVTVPSPAAMRAAHAALNPNGRLVIVGCPPTTGSSSPSSRPSSRASRSSAPWSGPATTWRTASRCTPRATPVW